MLPLRFHPCREAGYGDHLTLPDHPSCEHSTRRLIALLYKVRWDAEKVFDEFKNKLAETKAWASSANAKTVQARMLCLTHNLMTLMEENIRTRCGVSNQAEFKRREQRQAGKPAAPHRSVSSSNVSLSAPSSSSAG